MSQKKINFPCSRADALDDGVLVDISAEARNVSFRYPVAMTRAAWNRCVHNNDRSSKTDQTERLRQVLKVLRMEILGNPNCSTVSFDVKIRNDDGSIRNVKLKSTCGPGDDAEPVITILLANQN